MRRRGRTVVAVLVAIVCALALPAFAAAGTFEVDSVDDQQDASVGAEGCLTADGKCTLRAAIEEANVLQGDPGEEKDTIEFAEAVFDGSAAATIVLGDSLPPIIRPLYVRGTRECEVGGVFRLCVGVSGPANDAAVVVEGGSEVEFERLAITDAEVGIAVEGSIEVKVFGSWFGVKVGGGAGPNGTGIFLGPGSDEGVIGRPGEGNLFANSGVGLDLFGASRAEVQGNQFGVEPDGSTPAPNGKDIEVTSDVAGSTEAKANEIGFRVSAGSLGGPCDSYCNLISGATGIGLDLQGDGGAEAPAVGTVVTGNYVGLDAAGQVSVANAGSGIRVGGAPQTVIGGSKAGDANYFSGGAAGIGAGPGAPDLVVRGNRVGVDGLGRDALAPARGIAVDSTGLTSPADEAILAGNELRMGGGTGILQQGFGAWIVGNEISGAEMGIQTSGGVGAQGNVIERNSVTASTLDAILIENDLNDVVGNLVFGAGRAGIAVRGEPSSGIVGNVIGGDSADEENEIGGVAGPAIAIENTEGSLTAVARNRGSANTGLFIDLLRAAPSESNDPNEGIAPPSIFGAAGAGVVGSGEPGATVRVFRKQTALAGEIAGFLGAALVAEDGSWSLAYGGLLPAGTPIAASQTSSVGGSSELALATTAGGGGGEDPGRRGGATDRTDGISPRTAILRGPQSRSSSRIARFRFASDEVGTRFQCRLDSQAFRGCTSPWRYKGLRPGKHVFAVRAIDAAGNVDPTAARRTFMVTAR